MAGVIRWFMVFRALDDAIMYRRVFQQAQAGIHRNSIQMTLVL